MRILCVLILASSLWSCTDPKENPSLTTTGKVSITLSHFWGEVEDTDRQEFKLNEHFQTTDRKDTVVFESFDYKISEILFKSSESGVWKDTSLNFTINIGEGGIQTLEIDSVSSSEFDLIQFYITDLEFKGNRPSVIGDVVVSYDLTAVENDRLFKSEFDPYMKISENDSPKIFIDINVKNIWTSSFDIRGYPVVGGTSKDAAVSASSFVKGWKLDRVEP